MRSVAPCSRRESKHAATILAILTLLMLESHSFAQQSPAPSTRPINGTARPVRRQDAILPPINASLPTLWIIGDSTVCNGQDRGENGQWGWGNPIVHYFDPAKINVVNFALGGTSSRSFQESIRWERILGAMKPGDYLIMQFGHNDGRGVLPGNGDETQAGSGRAGRAANGGNTATTNPANNAADPGNNIPRDAAAVSHTHGWYMRKYVADARAKGAKETIICSLIPRNNWRAGKVDAGQKYPQWDQDAAKQVNASFIDLHKIIVDKYEALGQAAVTEALFPEHETTHTDWAGAIANAQSVIDGLKQNKSELVGYLLPEPPKDLLLPSGKAR